jgi:2-oxoglutarate ferredoxin oxidoreductase subunit alpha
MPTKHSQDDLMAAVFGSHGEGQRIILSASTVTECFYLTMSAFDMARRFRCPVILLTDSALGNLQTTCRRPDPNVEIDGYVKPAHTAPVPQTIAVRRVTGLEHDTKGIPSDTANNRIRQQYKRFSKMDKIESDYGYMNTLDIGDLKPPMPKSRFAARMQDNSPPADLCVVSWGITATMTRAAVSAMRGRGIRIACLYPRLLFPFVSGHYLELLNFCPRIAVVESNYTGQLASMIRMNAGINTISVKKYGGEPFTPEEIEAELCGIIDMEQFIKDIGHENGGEGTKK